MQSNKILCRPKSYKVFHFTSFWVFSNNTLHISLTFVNRVEKKNMLNFVAAVKYFFGAKRWTVQKLKFPEKNAVANRTKV